MHVIDVSHIDNTVAQYNVEAGDSWKLTLSVLIGR